MNAGLIFLILPIARIEKLRRTPLHVVAVIIFIALFALAGQALLFFLIKKVGKKIKAVEKWLQITAFA
jgi:hypothetical protein